MPKKRYAKKARRSPSRRKSFGRRRRSKVLVPLNYARQRFVTALEIPVVEEQTGLKLIIPW